MIFNGDVKKNSNGKITFLYEFFFGRIRSLAQRCESELTLFSFSGAHVFCSWFRLGGSKFFSFNLRFAHFGNEFYLPISGFCFSITKKLGSKVACFRRVWCYCIIWVFSTLKKLALNLNFAEICRLCKHHLLL